MSMIGWAHGLMVLWWQTWEFIKLCRSTRRRPLRRQKFRIKTCLQTNFTFVYIFLHEDIKVLPF